MVCKHCGVALPQGSRFCLKCGKKQPGEQNPAMRRQAGNRRGVWIAAIAACSAALVLVMAFLFSYLGNISPSRSYARDSERMQDLYDLKLALSLYYTDHGAYPDALDALTPSYLEELPEDPLEGMPIHDEKVAETFGGALFSYRYIVEDGGQGFALLACGEWEGKKVVKVGPYE